LPAKLVKGVWTQSPAEQTAQVLRAKVDVHWLRRLQGVGLKTDRADVVADGAAAFFGALDQRLRFAEDECLLAVGAVDLGGDAIPAHVALRTATARGRRKKVVPGNQSDPVHGSLPPGEDEIFARTSLSSATNGKDRDLISGNQQRTPVGGWSPDRPHGFG